MSEAIIKKNGTDYPLLVMPNHYPADRVYLDGDTTKNVQDKCARKADLTNLDLTGTTNTTGSTIASGTYFYLNGTLVRAKTAIASGATFTLNTNYEAVTVGTMIGGENFNLIKVNNSDTISNEKCICILNRIVMINFTISKAANTGQMISLAQIPSLYRPTGRIQVIIGDIGRDITYNGLINVNVNDGVISLTRPSSDSSNPISTCNVSAFYSL